MPECVQSQIRLFADECLLYLPIRNVGDQVKLNLRLEHFESYSSFSYCMHSSVYRVYWPSGRVVDCNILILLRHSTSGPEHLIYRFMCTVWKAWITFKMLCAQISNFVHIQRLVFFILLKVSINSRTIAKISFILFFRKIYIFCLQWRPPNIAHLSLLNSVGYTKKETKLKKCTQPNKVIIIYNIHRVQNEKYFPHL